MTDSETDGTTRRHALRTAVNLGVGGALVWAVGADYATSDGQVEVTYALARSSPEASVTERTTTVPAEWHARTHSAFEVHESLRETGLSSLVGSFVVPGNFDDPSASLAVDATSDSAVEELAELGFDIEIDVEILEELPPKPTAPEYESAPFQVTDVERRSVPGGVHCQSPSINGTLAPAAFDAERDRRYFLTSNHVFGAQGTNETEHRDEPLDLKSGGQLRTIGRVERGYPEADVVRVAPVDDYRPVPEVAGAVPATVSGQFTRIGLADLYARGEALHKFGAFSGHTEGPIHGVDGITCYLGEVCKPGQVKWGDERTITDGDSGSISYRPDPERPDSAILAAGVNNARSWWPGADFTWGTAAYRLRDEYGMHF